MLYFTLNANGTVTVSDSDGAHPRDALSRWDFKTFDDARDMAARAGDAYMAVDQGDCCSPRYDVVEKPKIGDDVSYGFNGDYYPCGKIVKISDSLRRIETDSGAVFYRRKLTSRWIKQGGTWSLVHGIVEAQNPSF